MTELCYQTIRSPKRKKLTITVERDRTISVRAPEETSDEEVQKIVDRKRQWILEKLRHPQKYQNRPHPPGKEVVNGESALFLGREYRIELVETVSGEVEFNNQFLVPAAQQLKRRQVLRDWYVVKAKEVIVPRAELHARELGVQFTRSKIVDNRYRWGSCTAIDTLSFNWRLIKAPMFVIDYVVVHEVAHLLEPNHNSRFWGIVKSRIPSMGIAKSWLRDHGQVLEEEI